MKKSVVRFKGKSPKEKIKLFFSVIQSFHSMTEREIDIATELIYDYQGIANNFKKPNHEMICKYVFSTENRKIIRERLKIKEAVFNNYLEKLRKKNVIKDNCINPSFIPPVSDFSIEFIFE